ncbi:MAG: hypothetical protein LBG72_04305 [Spirochaetaceae bacterium]|nr:hypothetical protein [Spirochaetaceae bacterium]
MLKIGKIQGVSFVLFLCFAALTNAGAQAKIDKNKKLDELQKVDPSKLTGVWECQGRLEIDGNSDVETIQFNEDGSIIYRLNGQIGLFPTPYTYVSNYGQIEIKAVFDFYLIEGSLIVQFADKRVKNFTRRRTAPSQQQQAQQRQMGQQQVPQQQTPPVYQQQVPQQQPPVYQTPQGSQSQNLNPYLR